MKVNIEYSKDKEQIHIMWKVDNKRKQKFKLSSYLETETHFGIMRQFFSQINSDLILACGCYTDCDFNRLKGYQDQAEIVEIVSCLEKNVDRGDVELLTSLLKLQKKGGWIKI